MARTVTDATYLLQAIVGKDVNDNYTSAIPSIPNYLASLNYNGLRGARLGVPANIVAEYATNDTTPEINAFNAAIKLMQAAGATIITTNLTAIEDYSSGNESVILETDFINNLATYLSELTYNPNNIHTLADLLNFTKTSPLEDYPDRDVSVWETAGARVQQHLASSVRRSPGRRTPRWTSRPTRRYRRVQPKRSAASHVDLFRVRRYCRSTNCHSTTGILPGEYTRSVQFA